MPDDVKPASPEAAAEPLPHAPGEPPRRWTSEELLAGQPEALIEHGGDLYRLRCTRNGKLILYK